MRRVRTVLVGVRSNSSRTSKEEPICERLRAQDFAVSKACRYGFPYQPTSIAVDSVQGIVAVGTYTGGLRIFGKPGIEAHVQHESSSPVRNLLFMSNEGALISCCPEDSIHLWNLRQAEPVIVQSLRFNRERITALHLPFTSKWLFVGTEKGNVHIVNIERFEVSGYTINWNKAIEVTCKTHPGPVVQISDNPLDANKILLGFESGIVVLWSLRSKSAEQRFYCPQKSLHSLYWLNDGKQFMSSHTDGTLGVWNLKCTDKPAETLSPHSNGKSGKERPCAPISKVKWLATSSGDPIILFSGGTQRGKRKGLTLCQGKTTKLLTAESILDFTVILSSPWAEDAQDPRVVIAVTPLHLIVFDLLTSSSKPLTFDVPYAFDIHESPVTCTQYFSDCPPECIADIGNIGNRPKKRQLSREASRQAWPIVGGVSGDQPERPPTELVITGHADGTVKFWDASTVALFLLYKMSTTKNFEREKSRSSEDSSDNAELKPGSESSEGSNHRLSQTDDTELYSVQMIDFCVHSRILLVAGTSYVILYQFSMTEQSVELIQIELQLTFETPLQYPNNTPVSSEQDSAFTQPGDRSSTSSGDLMPDPVPLPLVTAKTGTFKRHKGFQADLVCIIAGGQEGWPICNISQSSQLGIVSICSGPSLALVDVIQKKLITVLSANEMSILSESFSSGNPQTPQSATPLSPATPITPITTGTPLSFTLSMDPSGGIDFSEPVIQKVDKKKPKPARPPPPLRTKSFPNKSGEGSNGGECVDSQAHTKVYRSVSYPSVTSEGPPDTVQCTKFACTYTKKNDNYINPCLIVGTTKGNVFMVVINMPPAEERLIQPILTIVTGTVFRPKSGMVMSLSLLDCQGHLFPSPLRFWTDKKDENQLKKTVTTRENSEKHFLVVNTEREAKVYQLPPTHNNPTAYSKTSVADDSSVVLASEVVIIEGSSCLMCLTSLGQLMAFSLPSLTMLINAECSYLLTDFRYLRTLKFSDGGLAITMCSPYEIQKLCMFTRNDKYQMSGQMSLFRPMDMPERPTKGFFTSLFSTQASPIDREQLFGVQCGAASRSVAERVQGPGIEQLQEVSVGLAGAMQKNRDALMERGEKLHHLDKATANLASNAQNFADMSNQIKLKYKEKRWYQV